MRCPQCQHELIKTKVGNFCLNCGYAGPEAPENLVTKQAVTKPEALEIEATEPAVKAPATHARAPSSQASPATLNIDTSEPSKVESVIGVSEKNPVNELSKPTETIIDPPAQVVHMAPVTSEQKINDSGQAEAGIHKLVPTSPPIHLADAEPLPAKPQPAQVFHPLTPIKVADSQPVASRVAGGKPGSEGQPPAAPPPKSQKPGHDGREHPHHLSKIYLVIIIVIGLGLVLAAYILPARAAVKAWSTKLSTAQSYRFSGSLQLHGSTFLQVLNSNLNFSGAYQAKGASNLNYQGTFASRQYDGQFIASGGNLYTEMTGNDLPFIRYNQGLNTYHLLPSTWYVSKVNTGLYKYYCQTTPDTKYPSPLVWYQALRQIKLQPSPLVGYDAKVDGHSTTHLRGSISGKDLNIAWNNINSSLPNDCQWNNLLEDVSGMNVKFDLWTSSGYDQIQLHLADKDLGLTGTVVLKLDQYNQATGATPPTSTLDLGTIFSGRVAVQARDFQRQADINALKKALDAYASANKSTPPTTLVKLVPKYIAAVPKDPNGSSYAYSVNGKKYTLSATLEDTGQLYTVTGP